MDGQVRKVTESHSKFSEGVFLVLTKKRNKNHLINGLAYKESLVAQWLERPNGISVGGN